MSSQPMSSDPIEKAPRINKTAVALISGGLDSALAIKLVQMQGIEVIALHFTSQFTAIDPRKKDTIVVESARELGVPLHFIKKGDDFVDIIRHPKYGHGKNLNPCIDCRIYTLKLAKQFMEEMGAGFLVTGEVVGQRPMSQLKNTLRMIEKRAGCDGLILRPLSAQFLPPSLPELEGLVQRESLQRIAGRGRKIQLRLAKEFGLTKFAAPAGGCLLTDKIFSKRLRDLLEHDQSVDDLQLELLHLGRHIRFRPDLKIIVGRSEIENDIIDQPKFRGMRLKPFDFPAPVVFCAGKPTEDEIPLIAGVLMRYTKPVLRGNRIIIEDELEASRVIEHNTVTDDDWISQRLI
jgi:hypothetical protein